MKKRHPLATVAAVLLAAVCIVPFLYVLLMSLKSVDGRFSLQHYYTVLLGQTEYIYRFWKSVGISLCAALFQTVVSALAGFGFARYRFRGRNALFFLLMILMILPLQVVLMPNYMVLETLGLLYTDYALIVPAVFVPLGTVIMTQSIKAVPAHIVDAARLDGANPLQILMRVVLPGCSGGLACTFLLSFLDSWNMVEQPITYLRDFLDYPIAVALATAPPGDPTVLLCCCVLVALPALFLFAYFNRELAESIDVGGEK